MRLVATLALAMVCLAPAGCGAAGPRARTFVGPVTVVSHDSVCVGGPDASGECFVKDEITQELKVSDCIRVTYTPPDDSRLRDRDDDRAPRRCESPDGLPSPVTVISHLIRR